MDASALPSETVLRRRATWVGACALAAMIASAGPARAQKTDNDYYASAGTDLLRSVEKYHVVLAENEIRTKYYVGARADLDFTLRYFPNHPRGLLLMVQLCSEDKKHGCDLDLIFERAIAVNPYAVGTYVTLGVYLHRAKRYSEAIESYRRALALDPDSINGHYNLGLAYLEAKQYDLANEQAQRAYALGAPLPGLRERLQKAGQWRPIAAAPASPQTAAPASAGAAAAEARPR